MELFHSECVPVRLQDFKVTMDLLILEPNIISPSVLRAEVIADEKVSRSRIVKRILVPRQKRDNSIWQQIEITCTQEQIVVRYTAFQNGFKELATAKDLPYFYPKYSSFSYGFQMSEESAIEGIFSIYVSTETLEEIDKCRMQFIWSKIFKHIKKILLGTRDGYKKRVYHDVVIDKVLYQNRYQELKDKYQCWVAKWPESTDPQKHVFEDIGIATWLILLWEKDSPRPERKQKFIDLGCGNGFLTYILISEGFQGVGVDMSSRKLWNQFPEETRNNLIERCINPGNENFSDFEYIIGNHSDELTPWIPLLAMKSQCKWAMIPCCPFKLDGQKFTLTSKTPGQGRYQTYCQFLKDFCKDIGWRNIEIEHLRIPSTKNVCLLSRSLEAVDLVEKVETARMMIEEMSQCMKIRKTDREKTQEMKKKKKDRGL